MLKFCNCKGSSKVRIGWQIPTDYMEKFLYGYMEKFLYDYMERFLDGYMEKFLDGYMEKFLDETRTALPQIP